MYVPSPNARAGALPLTGSGRWGAPPETATCRQEAGLRRGEVEVIWPVAARGKVR